MQILDWRPRSERILTSVWRRRATGDTGLGERWWAKVHDRLVARRVDRRPAPPGVPLLVSVGNLALGGTGKTPVVIALARELAAHGHRGAVLTRGYRSPLPGPVMVSARNERAGDEARLLAQALAPQDWPVVQARSRPAGLRHILAGGAPAVVLIEDGHQTAGVGRDLDVLILDHWQVRQTPQGARVAPQTGPVFPFGPWRESATGAARAHIWLLETEADVPRRGVGEIPVATFRRAITCRAVNGRGPAPDTPQQPALVSGIARPGKFEAGAQELLTSPARLAVRLADHEPYSEALVQRVRHAVITANCGSLVTTAKDWLKIAPHWGETPPAFVIDLEIVWGNGETLPELVGKRLKAAEGRKKSPSG